MSFLDLQNFATPPPKVCGAPYGSILNVFPAIPLDAHSRLGYSFRSEPCASVSGYNPDICASPGDMKMTPEDFGDEGLAQLRVLQAAFRCSSVGTTDEELRDIARSALDRNYWRAVDQALVDILATEDDPQGAPATARCLLADAGQYLASSSYCGIGVIYGPARWVSELGTRYLVREGDIYRDVLGNYVIPSSIDLADVYAFDSEVEVRTSDIEILDEFMPGLRTVNDRVIRAEMLFTVAVDNCVVGSWTVPDCA